MWVGAGAWGVSDGQTLMHIVDSEWQRGTLLWCQVDLQAINPCALIGSLFGRLVNATTECLSLPSF